MCLSGAHYSIDDIEDRIIEMAWEDRTPFEAIEYQFGMKENDVRKLMRENLTRKSFELWRKRVKGRKTNIEPLLNLYDSNLKISKWEKRSLNIS